MKNRSLLIRALIILVITLIGIYLVFGPRGSVSANDFTVEGIKNNLAKNINLGLDLKGGSHLVMRVKTDDYLKKLTENNQIAAFNAVKDAQIPVGDSSFAAENNNYQITLNVNDAADAQKAIEEIKKKVDLSAWTESTNGNTLSWTLPAQAQ